MRMITDAKNRGAIPKCFLDSLTQEKNRKLAKIATTVIQPLIFVETDSTLNRIMRPKSLYPGFLKKPAVKNKARLLNRIKNVSFDACALIPTIFGLKATRAKAINFCSLLLLI